MEIYLVGGAVRDQLLGLPVKERDWVVVGASPKEMLDLGYRQVGRDFPVFLHPKTHEEYALARTERKTGKGYVGFACDFDPTVTLEDDLKRRDLTINAIAQDQNGKIIDPYNGQQDLKNKILRHVSPAFAEDPVRILRIARFAATFGDFAVHPNTLQLMRQMLASGEIDALVSERVWQELEKALSKKHSYRFFEILNGCQILQKLFPEIAAHFKNVITILKLTANADYSSIIRFAAISYFFKHIKLHIPNAYRDLAYLATAYVDTIIKSSKLDAEDLMNLLEKTDALRRPDRFEQLLQVCEINSNPRGIENINKLRLALIQAKKVCLPKELLESLDGKEIAEKLREERIKEIKGHS